MRALALTLALATLAAPASAQLASQWMIPAAAHTAGIGGTFWATDLSLHNPHQYTLPVVIWVLPSDRDNTFADGWTLDLGPYETVNLWDALGPDTFDVAGTAALLVLADDSRTDCGDPAACAFLATSRTYTPAPGGDGEYGQGIPGRRPAAGVDWSTYGYVAGILNDGDAFRCNVGAASWSDAWTTVRVDVQDATGTVIGWLDLDLPPFGHVQRRLPTAVEGGSLVFYLVDGPADALVFPYASVVNQATGDPTYLAAEPSEVGVTVAGAARVPAGERPTPEGTRRALSAARARRAAR